MRVLALDIGDKRIGVAVSDPVGLIATPLTTITRRGDLDGIEQVLRLADEQEAGQIIAGIPLSLSGKSGPQADRVAAFVQKLTDATTLPIKTVDERYSTVEAERLLREIGVKPSRDRARVDAAAAAVILQSYLDSVRSGHC